MPGLLRGMARTAVVAGTATAVSNRVSRRQARKWSNEESESAQNNQPDNSGSDTDELEKMAQLKDKGVITQEEFDAKKKQILGI